MKPLFRDERAAYKPCLAAVIPSAEEEATESSRARARLNADLSNLALVDLYGLSPPVYFSLRRAKVGNPTLPYLSLPFCAPHTKSGTSSQFTFHLPTHLALVSYPFFSALIFFSSSSPERATTFQLVSRGNPYRRDLSLPPNP